MMRLTAIALLWLTVVAGNLKIPNEWQLVLRDSSTEIPSAILAQNATFWQAFTTQNILPYVSITLPSGVMCYGAESSISQTIVPTTLFKCFNVAGGSLHNVSQVYTTTGDSIQDVAFAVLPNGSAIAMASNYGSLIG